MPAGASILGRPRALLVMAGVLAAALVPLTVPIVGDDPQAGSDRDSVVVAAAGDIACTADEEVTDQRCQHERTAQLVEDLDPGLVLALGDLQYPTGRLEDFEDSYDPTWGRFKDITRPVLGNHEYDNHAGEGYFEYFGDRAGDPSEGYYSFDAGSWHVVALNSECGEFDCLDAGSDQLAWLTEDLARSEATCTLAMLHRPRFSSDEEHGDNPRLSELWQVLQDGGVDVVLSSHAHDYERFAPLDAEGRRDEDGIRSFVVGTGGRSSYELAEPHPGSEVAQAETFGVLAMTLRPEEYTWEFLPVEGEEFTDSGTAACRAG